MLGIWNRKPETEKEKGTSSVDKSVSEARGKSTTLSLGMQILQASSPALKFRNVDVLTLVRPKS